MYSSSEDQTGCKINPQDPGLKQGMQCTHTLTVQKFLQHNMLHEFNTTRSQFQIISKPSNDLMRPLPSLETAIHGNPTTLINPARPPGRTLANPLGNPNPIEGENREVILGNLFRLRHDVMRDQRSSEPICSAVLVAAMDDAAVEEHDVAALHDGRNRVWGAGRAWGLEVAPLLGIQARGDGLADDGQGGGGGDEHHATILLVAVVKRQPRRDAGAGVRQQVHIVLVEVLAAGAWGLEVHHGLHGVRLGAHERREGVADARVDHVGERDVVAAVGLQQARVALQGIRVCGIHGILRVAVAAALDHGGEVVCVAVAFGLGEEVAHNCEAVALEGGDYFGV